jgi:hypothetical protein
MMFRGFLFFAEPSGWQSIFDKRNAFGADSLWLIISIGGCYILVNRMFNYERKSLEHMS